MIDGRDSSASRPTPDQARQLYAAGVRVWGGYLATRSGVGLYSVWDRASFQVVQDAGMRAIGFCSGWDDPYGVASLGASWGVLPCLDDEDGIRPRGTWEQGWLNVANSAAPTGLYALATPQNNHHAGLVAPFHIAAWYPFAPAPATWPPGVARPATPTAWQYWGTHDDHGVSVDSLWLDDWFAGPAPRRARTGGDAMAFCTPDVTGEALFEVLVSGGEATWGAFEGGAGEWLSYTDPYPSLGSPEGAKDLVRASGTFTTHAGHLRLNVHATRANGTRWVKVMDPIGFGVLADWAQAPGGPLEDVPGSAPDSALRAYLKDGPA